MSEHERDHAPAPLELEGAPADLESAGLDAFDAPSPPRTPRDTAGVPEEKESEARDTESLDSCLASISSEMARLNGLLEQHKDGSAIEHIHSLEEGHLSSQQDVRALLQKSSSTRQADRRTRKEIKRMRDAMNAVVALFERDESQHDDRAEDWIMKDELMTKLNEMQTMHEIELRAINENL